MNQGNVTTYQIETSYVFQIISTIITIIGKGPITSNYEESRQTIKMKMDRRPLLMQNIKVRQSWM